MRVYLILVILFSFVFAEEKTATQSLSVEDKIALMLINERKIAKNRELIYKEEYENPFKDKDFGLELNIPFLLISAAPQNRLLSGTISFFYPQSKIELAFPFLLYTITDEWKNTSDTKYGSASLDIHFRKFFGDYLDGFYISAFARATYIKGILGEDFMYDYGEELSGDYGTQKKFGLGLGIGYRVFSKYGIYWGTSLSIGKYYTDENNMFANNMFFEDSKSIIDIEFLKLGYAF